MMLHTDYQKVRDLGKKVGTLCLTMLELANELDADLETLKKTFSDDGIQQIEGCLNGIFDALALHQQDMVELAKTLISFADRLEATK